MTIAQDLLKLVVLMDEAEITAAPEVYAVLKLEAELIGQLVGKCSALEHQMRLAFPVTYEKARP